MKFNFINNTFEIIFNTGDKLKYLTSEKQEKYLSILSIDKGFVMYRLDESEKDDIVTVDEFKELLIKLDVFIFSKK